MTPSTHALTVPRAGRCELQHYINDPTHPFGHGFVVAAELAGIPAAAYTAVAESAAARSSPQ